MLKSYSLKKKIIMLHSPYRLFLHSFPCLIRGFVCTYVLYKLTYYTYTMKVALIGTCHGFSLYVILLTQLSKVEKRICCGCTLNV